MSVVAHARDDVYVKITRGLLRIELIRDLHHFEREARMLREILQDVVRHAFELACFGVERLEWRLLRRHAHAQRSVMADVLHFLVG